MNPRTDIVEVAALLIAARTVVADPARWCAYPHALDANGHRCEGRTNAAVCWGAVGALDRVLTPVKKRAYSAVLRRGGLLWADGCSSPPLVQ